MANGVPWTAAENAILREGAAKGMLAREMQAMLPGRSLSAVTSRLQVLGLAVGREEARRRLEAGRLIAVAEGRCGVRKGTKLGPQSRDVVERRLAKLKRALQDPEVRARHRDGAIRGATSPKRDRAKIGAKVSQTKLAWCPVHLRDEYRQIALCNTSSRVSAAEGRRMILDKWNLQLRRALRQIAAVAAVEFEKWQRQAEAERAYRRSFAGQMERLKAGAALVPTLRLSRAVGTDRSLTGNAEALL